MEDWWLMSKRLRKFIYTSPLVFGFRWIEECGHKKVLIIKMWDVYREEKS